MNLYKSRRASKDVSDAEPAASDASKMLLMLSLRPANASKGRLRKLDVGLLKRKRIQFNV